MSIPRPWSRGERIAFRFFFAFFVLYIFPFPVNVVLPFAGTWYNMLWSKLVPWAGEHIVHLPYPITIFPNGSGDTTFNYVQLMLMFLLAVLVMLTWSLVSKRKQYNALHHWLRVALRFYLGGMMVSYGFAKVFHAQMPSPGLAQLIQPFGDKSPMGLAWSYIGYSEAFSAFTGWAEVIAGLLLFWRRTVALGALVNIVVAANIVAINFCFDVPVKLFSSTLLLMAIFLLAPDAKRLLNVLVLNRPVEKRTYRHYLPKRWMRITALVISLFYIAGIVYAHASGSRERGEAYSYSMREAKTPLFGIYNASLIVRNSDTVPMLLTDTTHWKQLIIQRDGFARVKLMNDSMQDLAFRVDTTQRTATIFRYTDTLNKSVLTYMADSTSLLLKGVYQQDSVYFQYVKMDYRSFRLLSRGFHWINEYPYNR